jgi:rhamnosyltransferase
MATLPALLDAIDGQESHGIGIEVVAVDSSSTDGTADLLRRRASRVVGIARRDFDHGLARNLGIEQSRGDLIVLLVQDAVPASSRWLAELVAPLMADARVAGTFARQRPRGRAPALTRYYLARWAASSDVARTVAVEDVAAFEALEPEAQLETCTFDNVCSCIRRTVWERYPFRATPIAEDLEWAREVLLAGYRLAYVPAAVVVHSHDRSARHEFVRTYRLHRRLYELFRLRTIPTAPALARSIASSLALHVREGSGAFSERARGLALAFAWPLGQYLGARAAARARQK